MARANHARGPMVLAAPVLNPGGVDHEFSIALRALDVLADGTLTFETIGGGSATYTFDAAADIYPYRIENTQITKIVYTGGSATTIGASDLIPYI